MRRLLAIPLVILVASCLHARSDARIRPGGQIGLASSVMWTPDAEVEYNDSVESPSRTESADFRAAHHLWIAYGWKRVELRYHYPFLKWTAGDDYPEYMRPQHVEYGVPLVAWLELYVQVVQDGPWHVGLGAETVPGGYAIATYVIGPGDAISVTARGTYGGSDDGDLVALGQGQLAYTRRLDPDHDLNVFVSGLWAGGDRVPINQDGDYLDPGDYSRVSAGTIGILGASIDWH